MRKKSSEILKEPRLITLGGRIDKILMDARMNQEDIAKLANVTPQSVSQWIRNLSYPSFDNLGKIATLKKNLNIEWFFTGHGDQYVEDKMKYIQELESTELRLRRKLEKKENEIRKLRKS